MAVYIILAFIICWSIQVAHCFSIQWLLSCVISGSLKLHMAFRFYFLQLSLEMHNLLIAFLIESPIWDHDSATNNRISKNPISGSVGELKHDRNPIIVSLKDKVTTTSSVILNCVFIELLNTKNHNKGKADGKWIPGFDILE